MLFLSYVALILFFLAWGSFLNSLSYRLIHGNLRVPRSFCPHCQATIPFYDLIPLVSYLVLQGTCRACKQKISILYPSIELLSVILFISLALYIDHAYFFGYFIFFSALIITIRSDLETMLISQWATLALIPIGFVFSYHGLLPLTFPESMAGALIGALFLYLISSLFKWLTKKEGLGQGDIDLIAFIGSFTGVIGCWASLLIGSLLATLCILPLLFLKKITPKTKIPFGPFLAFGALLFVFFQDYFYGLFSIGI